jgi:hypothetical protein
VGIFIFIHQLLVGEIFKLAADLNGGKARDSRQVANFVARLTAGSTGTATAGAQKRREQGNDPPLHECRHCTAGTRERSAANAKIEPPSRQERKEAEKSITQRLQDRRPQRESYHRFKARC